MTDRSVLVIGAGVAGLAAASTLSRAGRRVVLIEARDRIGGRVYSLHPPGVTRPIELGAEFIHGHSNALWPLLKRAGLATRPVAERHQGIRKGRAAPLPDVRRTLRRLIETDTAARSERPLGDIIDEHRAAGDDPDDLAGVVRYVEGFHAADVGKIGVQSLAENETAEDEDGDEAFLLPSGYDAVPRWLLEQCAPSLDLRLATPLLALRWNTGSVVALVNAPSGKTEEVAAAQAVITLPLGVLKAAAEGGGVAIESLPPRWLAALGALEMGTSQRIVLRFDRPWWNAAGDPPISFVHGPGADFPVWWASRPDEEPRLTGWCGGPRALKLAGRSRSETIEAAIGSLVEIFGTTAKPEVERLLEAYHHDWISDPYAMGVYSYGGIGARDAREVLSEPVEGTIILGGEALAQRGRNATVHGALTSGQRAAELLLAGG